MRFAYGNYRHTEFEGESVGIRIFNEGWEGRLEAVHAPLGAFTGAFGAQHRDREFAVIDEEAFVPPTDTTQVAGRGERVLDGKSADS